MTETNTDLLIVGLGLAGGLLSWELIRRGRDLLVIDDNGTDSSSLAAAGLITPVTGKRLVMQPDAANLLAAAESLYHELAGHLGQRFLHPVPFLRLFGDVAEHDYFERRRRDPAYSGFIDREATAEDLAAFRAPCGGAWFKRTAYLDTSALIAQIGQELSAAGRLIVQRVDPAELTPAGGEIRWGNIRARRVVFCEGFQSIRNPWFAHLPWQAAKGEILHLEPDTPPPLPDAVVNWGKWLAPRADGSYRLGATYSWSSLDTRTTSSAREELLADLHDRVPGLRVRVIRQVAGVRPASRDRVPFLGHHRETAAVSVFNGFGAKGSLLIPWYMQRMADNLCDGTPLPEACDIARHDA